MKEKITIELIDKMLDEYNIGAQSSQEFINDLKKRTEDTEEETELKEAEKLFGVEFKWLIQDTSQKMTTLKDGVSI